MVESKTSSSTNEMTEAWRELSRPPSFVVFNPHDLKSTFTSFSSILDSSLSSLQPPPAPQAPSRSTPCPKLSQMSAPADEEAPLPIPNLSLPQQVFVLSNPALSERHEAARKELIEGIEKDGKFRLYDRSKRARARLLPPLLLDLTSSSSSSFPSCSIAFVQPLCADPLHSSVFQRWLPTSKPSSLPRHLSSPPTPLSFPNSSPPTRLSSQSSTLNS